MRPIAPDFVNRPSDSAVVWWLVCFALVLMSLWQLQQMTRAVPPLASSTSTELDDSESVMLDRRSVKQMSEFSADATRWLDQSVSKLDMLLGVVEKVTVDGVSVVELEFSSDAGHSQVSCRYLEWDRLRDYVAALNGSASSGGLWTLVEAGQGGKDGQGTAKITWHAAPHVGG